MKNTLILAWVDFKPHLVGVIIGGMKYEGEKKGEKNEVCGYLVDSEKWKGFGGI